MSISSEIARISGNVSDSLTAVASKGITVPSGSNSDDLPDLIAQIPNNYSVTLSLTGASSSATTNKVVSGGSYFTEITPTTSGHKISSITVTMGNVDITSQVFKPGVGAKAITANGTYTASNDALSGYSSVVVSVPGGGGSVTITDEANATGTTCVITTGAEPTPTPSGTWETIYDDVVYVWDDGGFNVNNTALPLFGADEQWRVTYFDGTVYECTTAYNGSEYYIGNLVLSDLSGLPFNIVGYTWSTVGNARVSIESPTFFPLKLEKFVTE